MNRKFDSDLLENIMLTHEKRRGGSFNFRKVMVNIHNESIVYDTEKRESWEYSF